MEDRLRHVLSVRTLIEMSLIRASRIASTATIEELMRAVRALQATLPASALGKDAIPETHGMPHVARPTDESLAKRVPPALQPSQLLEPSAPPQTSQAPQPSSQPPQTSQRSAILNDKLVNDIVTAIPGSQVIDIKEYVK